MVLCSVQKFFFGQHELEYFFFPQNLTLGYMTKTLNQIFFFLHQNQNIFFSNIGNQNIFLEKNHNPTPPWKLNGPSLNRIKTTLSCTTMRNDLYDIITLSLQHQKGSNFLFFFFLT